MVPQGPLQQVAGPEVRRLGVGRMQRRQHVVQRNVARGGDHDGAEEVDGAGREPERRPRLRPAQHRRHGDACAQRRGAEHRAHEPGVDGRDVDGLHGLDAGGRGNARERRHDEGREGEEDACDQAAAERCGHRCAGEEPAHDHTPDFADASTNSRKSRGARPIRRGRSEVTWALCPSSRKVKSSAKNAACALGISPSSPWAS